MTDLIDFEHYNCYWILLDILNKRPIDSKNSSEWSAYEKDLYAKDNNQYLEVRYNGDRPQRRTKIAKVKDRKTKYFYERYILDISKNSSGQFN